MIITLLNVSVEDKGKYKILTVDYKADGKAQTKKVMSFGASAEVFKTLSNASAGTTYTVTSVKNDKGYWDWTSVSQGGTPTAGGSSTGGNVANASPRSTYETPEERAARQVLIVRQSSVSSAIEYLKLNTKKVPSTEEVLQIARSFEDYVFGKSSGPAGLSELTDDIPY